jgi:hypothetical protein
MQEREKQIEIKVVTYEEERLNYFTALYEKAKNKFNRLFKKHKDAPYLSDEFQKMSDAGHEAEFLGDVVKMLKQSEWISVEERLPDKWGKYLAYRKCHFAPHVDIIRYDTNRSVWYFFDSEWGDCEVNDITHWMPLPEAPKEGGGE